MSESSESLKCKEQWLREEIRALRTSMQNVMQWGMTALTGFELILYYIRKDVYSHLVESNAIARGDVFPLPRWLIGTTLIFILGLSFHLVVRRQIYHLRTYRRQLIDMGTGFSGIKEGIPIGGLIGIAPSLMFFAVPLFDFFIWAIYHLRKGTNITLPW